MKHIYSKVYYELIESGKSNAREVGYHCHRIIPGYMGGTYDSDNIIYVSQKYHSLIHWLRWKLFGDFRDKKSYKMIGVGPSGLSHQDRVKHGISCKERSLGFHGASVDQKREWAKKGMDKQREIYESDGSKNFYYWSTPEGRKERASLGGKASVLAGNNPVFADNSGRWGRDSQDAKRCGALAAKKPVHDKEGNIKKFQTDELRQEFLENNPDWKSGTGMTHIKGRTFGPSHRRRKVTDGVIIFDSISDAALTYGKTSATIINWCRSNNKPNWEYVDE